MAADARSIRLTHLRAESEIKSVGQLCYLVASLSGFGMLEFVLLAIGVLPHPPWLDEAISPAIVRVLACSTAGFMFLLAAGHQVLGYGLTHLKAWARWTVVVLTVLNLVSGLGLGIAVCFVDLRWGLLGLAIGIALHAAILYPLLRPGAGVVFSERYREVIRATPEIRHRMHWLLKACLATLLAGVLGLGFYLAGLYLRLIG